MKTYWWLFDRKFFDGRLSVCSSVDILRFNVGLGASSSFRSWDVCLGPLWINFYLWR